MSEQSKQSRFATNGNAHGARAPIGAPTPLAQVKKANSLADLLRAPVTPLTRAFPFPERVAGAVPSIRAPKPRVVAGPTPKKKKKLPDSFEERSFLPRTKHEIPASADGSAAASPFHINTQAALDMEKPKQETEAVETPVESIEKVATNGVVSPFSIVTQAFDTTVAHKESAPEEPSESKNEDGIINMRPRTTIVPKGGLSAGNSPFSNIQPQAFVTSPRSGQATTGSSPFAFPTVESVAKKEHQPTSVSAPFSLTPTIELSPPTEAVTATEDAHTPEITPVRPVSESDSTEILYVPETEEETDTDAVHRPILPLHVEPVFTAPPTTTHISSWESEASLLSDSEASAEAEEALRAADYGYAPEIAVQEADDFAYYAPEEQALPADTEPVTAEEPTTTVTEIKGKSHYQYPSVSKSYDRAEDIPAYKRQITLALLGGWARVLAVLTVFATALCLSMADLFSISLPTILSPDIYPLIYRMADLELLLFGIILCLPIFLSGLSDLFHGKASPAAFFAVPTVLFVLVQITEICYGVITVGAPSVTYPLCSAPILLGCVLAALGRVLELHRQNTIFRHVAAGAFSYTVEAEPDGIACMRETSFPTNVAAHAAQTDACSPVSTVLLPLLLLLSLGCGILGGSHLDSVVGGLYIGALALVACFPIGRLLMQSGSALFQTTRSLSTYGSCVLSEVDAKKLAATETLTLPEAALFANSETQVTRIHLATEDHEDGKYVLQAIGDALGGGLRVGLTSWFHRNNSQMAHTSALVKTGGDEDGVELSVDGNRVLHIGRYTFMHRYRMAPLTYTEDDARAERQDKLQILFVAEEGAIFAKLFLHSSVTPALREELLSLSATGKQILVETDSPFLDQERLRTKLGDSRASIYVSYKRSGMCAPLPKPTQGGLLAEDTDGAIALLTELSKRQSTGARFALLSTASVLLGLGGVAVVLLAAPALPFVAPILSAVQLLHLPLSKRHPKRRD